MKKIQYILAWASLLLVVQLSACGGGGSDPQPIAGGPVSDGSTEGANDAPVIAKNPRLKTVRRTSSLDGSEEMVQTYSYDADGRILKNVSSGFSADEFVIDFSYMDERLVSVVDNFANASYTYQENRLVSILTDRSSGQETQEFTYDAEGKLIKKSGVEVLGVNLLDCETQTSIGVKPVEFNFDYSADNRLAAVTVEQSDFQIDYEYLDNGVISKRTSNNGCQVEPDVAEYTYNAAGLLSNIKRNAGSESHSYDEAGRLKEIRVEKVNSAGGVDLTVQTYEYDAANLVTTFSSVSDIDTTVYRYEYEAAICLTEVSPNPENRLEYELTGRLFGLTPAESACGYRGGY